MQALQHMQSRTAQAGPALKPPTNKHTAAKRGHIHPARTCCMQQQRALPVQSNNPDQPHFIYTWIVWGKVILLRLLLLKRVMCHCWAKRHSSLLVSCRLSWAQHGAVTAALCLSLPQQCLPPASNTTAATSRVDTHNRNTVTAAGQAFTVAVGTSCLVGLAQHNSLHTDGTAAKVTAGPSLLRAACMRHPTQ
jgi:hypothetical protein